MSFGYVSPDASLGDGVAPRRIAMPMTRESIARVLADGLSAEMLLALEPGASIEVRANGSGSAGPFTVTVREPKAKS